MCTERYGRAAQRERAYIENIYDIVLILKYVHTIKLRDLYSSWLAQHKSNNKRLWLFELRSSVYADFSSWGFERHTIGE